MRLVKLTLSGFKSFADTTEFTFEHAITGIVGPNGCGKSNVVDAIKWVLGERSSKSLRGTEMLDVIFAGSAGRKAGGMASVMLTFENPVMSAEDLAFLGIGARQENKEVASKVEHVNTPSPGLQPGIEGVEIVAGDEDATRAEARGSEAPEVTTSDVVAEPTMFAARGKRALPMDADIVEIERRLYRDGESEYLINGRKARLKDIRELFMDTGVGADAYSIIEQGKVDSMLLASPMERRIILEEAAGIAKYKQRRVEAQRKLERAQTNLKTTREQLENTERRLKMVRGQAAKARRFKELDGSLRGWRMALAFDQYDDLVTRIEGFANRQNELAGHRETSARELAAVEAQRQELELRRHEAHESQKELSQARLAAIHTQQQGTQRKGMLERSVEETTRQASVDRERIEQLQKRAGEAEADILHGRDRIAALGEQVAEAERRLQTAGSARAEALEQLNERRQSLSQKQAAVVRIDRERVQLIASIQADVKRADGLREQIQRLGEKLSRISEDQRGVQTQRAATAVTHAEAIELTASLEKRLEAIEQQVSALGADRKERTQRAGAIEQEFVRLDSRRATLQEMVETRAGFAEAVRAAMSLREKGEAFSGVIAPLADLIDVRDDVMGHAGWGAASAIEAALAADLQGLVCVSTQTLPTRDELAKLPGRVEFLPMAGVPAGACVGGGFTEQRTDSSLVLGTDANGIGGMDIAGFDRASLSDPRSRLVSVRSLVKPRDCEALSSLLWRDAGGDATGAGLLHELLDRLLGRTFLVDTLDAALLLAAGPMAGQRARFVTRDGVVLDESGRVTAGPSSGGEAAGLLSRRAELEQLSAKVSELRESLAAERRALEGVDAEAAALTQQAGQIRTQLAASQRQVLTEQNRLERLGADEARMSRERGSLEQESAQLSDRLTKMEQDRSNLQDRADRLGRLHEEEAAGIASLEADVRNAQARADQAGEQMTAAKVEVSTLAEQAGTARRELSRLELVRDEASRGIRDVATHLERHDARLAEHRAGIKAAEEAVELAQAEAVAVESRLAQVVSALSEAEQALAALGESLVAARSAHAEIEREWNGLEVSRREAEVRRDTLEQRTQEDLSIVLAAEYPDYRAMMAGGDVARIDQPEAARNIDTLKSEVKKLGNVNLDSLEEELTLEAQNDNLVKQVADIDTACVQLAQLIEQLNLISKDRFGDVFKKIQDNFGSDQGMFRKLFGGGKAEVRLMPLIKEVENPDGSISKVETTETDLLESGIEVMAKPPGKEPRSISQLSGGEKTLTAVALLMAIFRSKPSCFCVLDEVDAALDEGNVARFNNVIREYTDRSHFIVITHNKRTMSQADHLYGITQQERGVSTRVSVKFDQVGKNGEIKTSEKVLETKTSKPDEIITVSTVRPAVAGLAPGGALSDVTGGGSPMDARKVTNAP
jgi:chromosome segregation protein